MLQLPPIITVGPLYAMNVSRFDNCPLFGNRLTGNDVERQKNHVVQQYLDRIESCVDQFLVSMFQFDVDALPDNYLDVPPKDLSLIGNNLSVLSHCATDVFLPQSAVQLVLIQPLVLEVWRDFVDPLQQRLTYWLPLVRWDDQKKIRADLQHIDKMKELERTFLSADVGQKRMSDVVPVAGLIVSRLHRLENEHRTALHHWGRRASPNMKN